MRTTRVDPPLAVDEVTTLRSFLDYHRDTLRMKIDGLDAEHLRSTLGPSTMTLGGMMKHLALVEDYWFGEVFLGREAAEPWRSADWEADRDWEWHSAAGDDPEALRSLFDATVQESDRVLAEALPKGLDRLSVGADRRSGEMFNLRWILVHLIEEYARHNGHADLLRESIDGSTGE